MSKVGRGAVGLLLLVTLCLVSPVTALGATSPVSPKTATAVPTVTGPLTVTAAFPA